MSSLGIVEWLREWSYRAHDRKRKKLERAFQDAGLRLLAHMGASSVSIPASQDGRWGEVFASSKLRVNS